MSWKWPSGWPSPAPSHSHTYWHALGLRPRLADVAEKVPDGAQIVDVGTDHGKLPIALVRSGRVSRAIAGDIREAPLSQARLQIQRAGLKEQIELRLGDGLSILAPQEANVALMAGLSGETIAALLDEPDSLEALGLQMLLLQPNDRHFSVKDTLAAKGWRIQSETLTCDGGRLFLSLAAIPSTTTTPPSSTDDSASWFPWLAVGDPLLPAWIEVKREWLASIHQPDRPHPFYGEGYVQKWQAGLEQLTELQEGTIR